MRGSPGPGLWPCEGLRTPHRFDRRSPAIRYCAKGLTPALCECESASLAADAARRTLFSAPRRQTHLRHEGEQGDLRSRRRRGRETCAEQRMAVRGSPDPAQIRMAVRGSPDPAQIRPKVSRDSVLREKPHPALCESESASLATDAAQPNAFQVTPTTDSPASRGRTGRPAVMPTARSGDLRRAADGCARVSRPRTCCLRLCACLPTPHRFDRRSPRLILKRSDHTQLIGSRIVSKHHVDNLSWILSEDNVQRIGNAAAVLAGQ